MALTKVTYSMLDGAALNVLDYGAAGNGVQDDTSFIQTAINAAAGKVVYFPKGTYLISANLTVNVSNIKLVGDGADISTIKRANNSASEAGGLVVSQCQKVSIYGLGFDGNRANQSNTCSGVSFASAGGGVTDVILKDVASYNWGTSDNDPSTAPFAAGIQLYSATQVLIEGCFASNNGHYGVTTYECKNIQIIGCQSNQNLRHGFGAAGTFRFVTSNNLAIDNGQQGIWYRNIEDGVIANNVVRWTTTDSSVNSRTGIILKRSTVPGEEAGNNICRNITLSNNVVVNASDTVTSPGTSKGIYFIANSGTPNDIVATGNVVENCDNGFFMSNGDNINVSYNTIIGSKVYAIWDDGTNWSIINGNTIKNCVKTAIYSRGRYSAIKNNYIYSLTLDATNTYYGIHYLNRTDTVISGNEVNTINGTNQYLHAVFLDGAFISRNLCYHNQLKNSTNAVVGKSIDFGTSGVSNRDWDNFDGDGFQPYADKRYIGQIYLGETQSVPGIFTGEGSPENVVVARVGSLYLRSDGGPGTTLYVKEQFTNNTGWVAK